MPGRGFAVDVDGRMGAESGCEIAGVEDESARAGAFGLVVGGEGCGGVAETVATERESEDGDGRRVMGRRNTRLRLQEVQSMAAMLEERWWGAGWTVALQLLGIVLTKTSPGYGVVANLSWLKY